MKYVLGMVALMVVVASVVAALCVGVTNGSASLLNLANSTLSGIGIAIGGMLGSALVLRFKSARKFIGNVVQDIQNHSK